MIETSKENVAHDNGRRVGDVVQCAEIPSEVSRVDDKAFDSECSIPSKYCELPDDVQFANCPDAEITFGYSGCSFGLEYNDHNYAVEYTGAGSPPLPNWEENIRKSPLALREIGTEDFQSPPTIPVRLRSQSFGAASGINNVISQCNTSQVVIGSVIRCVCQYTHDDGKMVQCSKCSIWQHFDCLSADEMVSFDPNTPHECETCNPRTIDYRRALEIQRKKRASCQTKSLHNSVLAQHVRRLSADPSKTHTIVVNASTVTSCPRQFIVTAVANDKGNANNVSTTASTSSNTTPASVGRVSKRKQTLAMRNTGSSPPDTTPCSAPLTPTGEDGTSVILSRGQADELLSSKLLTHPQGSAPSRPSGLPSPTRPQWHNLVSPPTIVGHPMNKCVPSGHSGGLPQSRPSYVYPLKSCHPSLTPRTNMSNVRSARVHRPSQSNLLSPTNTSLCNQRRARERCNSNFESSDFDEDSDFSDHQSSPRMSQNLSGKTMNQKCDREFRSNGKFVLCQRVIMRDERSSMSSDEDDVWIPPPKNDLSVSLTAAVQQFRRMMTSWMQKEYQEADQMVYSNEVEKLLLKHNEHGIGENQADGRIRERLKLKHCRVIPLNTRLKLQKQNGEFQDILSSAAALRPLSPAWRVLEATHSLRKYDTVIEFKGRMLLKSEYEKEADQTKNFNPFVLFYEGYGGPDLCLNASNYGNDARFIRRSCFPNCDIGHLTESGRLHLIVRALCDIPIGTELTIGFDIDYKQCSFMECACDLPLEQCPVRQYTLSQYDIPNAPRQLPRPRQFYRRKSLKPRLPKVTDELVSRKCEPSTSRMVRPRERSLSKSSWYNRYNDYGSSLSPSDTSLSSCTDASDIDSSIHVNTSNALQVSSYDKDLEYDGILNDTDEIYEDSLRVSPSFNVRHRSVSKEEQDLTSKGRKNNPESRSSSCSASDAESCESYERGVSPFRATARQRSNQPPHSPRITTPSERTPVPSRVIARQPRVKTTVGGGGHVHQRRFTDPLPKTPKSIKTYTPRRDSKSKMKLPVPISARKRRESNDSRLSSASKDPESVMNETSHAPSITGEDDSLQENSTKESGEKSKPSKKKELEEGENLETPRKLSRDDRWLAAVMRRIEEQEAGAKRKRSKTASGDHPCVTPNTSTSVNGEIKSPPQAQPNTPVNQDIKEEGIEFDDVSTDPMEESGQDISGASDNEALISSRQSSVKEERKPVRFFDDSLNLLKESLELSTIKVEKIEAEDTEVPEAPSLPPPQQHDETISCDNKDLNDSKLSDDHENVEMATSCEESVPQPPDPIEPPPQPKEEEVEEEQQPVEPIPCETEPPPNPSNRKRRSSSRTTENETAEKTVELESACAVTKEIANQEPRSNTDQSKPDRWLRIALARIETEEKMIRRRMEREERRKKKVKQEKSEIDESSRKSTEAVNKKSGSDRDNSNSSIVENEEPCITENQTDPVEVIVKEVDAETGESNPTSLGGSGGGGSGVGVGVGGSVGGSVIESTPISKDENVPTEVSERPLPHTPVSKRRRSNRRISPGNKSGDIKDEKPCSSTMIQSFEFTQNEDSSFANDAKATVDSDSSSASLSSDEASQDDEDTRGSLLATSPASQLAGGRCSARQLRSSVGAIGGLDTPLSLTSRGRRGRPRRSSGGRGSVDCVTGPNVDTNDSSPGKNAAENCCDRIVYVNPSQKNPLERFARHKSQIERPVTPQMETREVTLPASEPPTPAPIPETPTLGVTVCSLASTSTPVTTDTPAPLKKRWRNYKPIDRSPVNTTSPQEPLLPPMKKRRLNFPPDDWQETNSPKKSPMKLQNDLPPLEEETDPSRQDKPEVGGNLSVTEDASGPPLCADEQKVLEIPSVDSPKLPTSGTEAVDESLPNHPISMPRKKLYLMHYEQEQLQMKLNEEEAANGAVDVASGPSDEQKSSSLADDEGGLEKDKKEETGSVAVGGESEGHHARLWTALIQFVKNPVTGDAAAIAETNEEAVLYPEEAMDPPVGPRTPSEPDDGEDRAVGPGTPASAEEWEEGERTQVSDHEGGDEEAEGDGPCDNAAANKAPLEEEEDEMLKEAQLLKRIHERDKQIMDMQELKSLERRKAKLEAQLRYIGTESAETTDNTRQEQGPTLNSTAVHNDIVRFTNHLKGHLERLKSQLNQPCQSGGAGGSQLRDVMPSTSTDRDKSPSVNQDKPRSRSRSPLSPQEASHTKTPPASDDDSSDSFSSNSSAAEQTRRHRHRHHGSHKKRRHHRSTHRHRHRSKHKRKHRRHRRDSTPNSSSEEAVPNMNKGTEMRPKEAEMSNFEAWEGLENEEEEVDSDEQMRYWNSESAMRRHYSREGGIRNCHFDDNIPEAMSNDPYFDHASAEAPPFVRRFPYPHFNPKMPPIGKNPEFHRTWHPGLRGGPGNRYRRRRPFMRHGPAPAAAPMPGQWETLPSPGLQHLQSVSSLPLQSQSVQQPPHPLPTQPPPPPQQQGQQPPPPPLQAPPPGRGRPGGRGNRGIGGRHRGAPGLHRGAIGPSAANIRQYYGGNLASHRNWHHSMY